MQRVVHPPYHPHARQIVIGDVAMDEVVSHRMLATPAAALVLQIVTFRRANSLGIGPSGCHGKQRRRFVEATVESRIFHSRLPAPADSSAMDVMHVENLGAPVDHSLLHRIAQVCPGDGRGRVTKGVGTVGQ